MDTYTPRYSTRLKVALRLSALGLAAIALAVAMHRSNNMTKQAIAKLEGRWLHVAIEAGGETYTEVGERDQQVWEIEGNQLTRYIDSVKTDVARIELQARPRSQDLDLVPIEDKSVDGKSGFFTRTLCLYSLQGDELRVAVSFYFAPSTAAEERKQAIKDAQTRPQSFDTTMTDRVAVMTFKRETRDNQP